MRGHWLLAPSLLAILALAVPAQAAELSYAGRLTLASGKPLPGPVDLEVRFYSSPTGGDPVGPTLAFKKVLLSQGVFQLSLVLSGAELQQVFDQNGQKVYVEIRADGATYPRQLFLSTPLALRVPVDGDTLNFDSDGKLAVTSVGMPKVSGLAAALAGKADSTTVASLATTVAAKANTSDVTALSGSLSTGLAGKADTNAALSGDVTGTLGASVVARIKGVAVATPVPASDSNKYLKYDGTNFVLSTISGSSGGTVTDVTATAPPAPASFALKNLRQVARTMWASKHPTLSPPIAFGPCPAPTAAAATRW